MRIEKARHARQDRRDDKDHHFHPRGIDAHRLGHHAAALERADGAARARVQQVLHRQHGQQHHRPDQVEHRAARLQLDAEERQDGDAVDAVVLAQELQVAEHEEQ
ncbi:hypothetical protein D3C86_1959070 [compost metagenome]